MNLDMWGAFLGGVGLFLLGMNLMTQGLMQAAGPSLRRILHAATASPRRGLLSGFSATAILQSSSAVTVATIGFVNAELMQLAQAIPVIFGSNVGTTITGWLVATLGFKVKVEVFALPMIGVGMAFRVVRGQAPLGRLGEALAGFGLFFIGVDVLKEAFAALATTTDLSRFSGMGFFSVLLYVIAGIVLTTLMQSSSAAMAMVLTAASGGLVAVQDAAALVIGANVGTTTTAMLSVIGASPAAKRLASAHVLFNLITAGIGLLLLPVLLIGIGMMQRALGMEQDLSLLLALFHTVFNVLGVLLLWSFIGRMTAFLEMRFQRVAVDEFQAEHLDGALVQMPALAAVAAGRELARSGDLAGALALGALNSEYAREPAFEQRLLGAEQLLGRIADYLSRVQRSAMQPAQGEAILKLMKSLTVQHAYLDTIRLLEPLAGEQAEKLSAELAGEWEAGRRAALRLLEQCGPGPVDAIRLDEVAAANKSVQRRLKKLRRQLLRAASEGHLKAGLLVILIERLDHLRQLADQAARNARARLQIEEVSQSITPEPVVELTAEPA